MKVYNLLLCLVVLGSASARAQEPDLSDPVAFTKVWEASRRLSMGGADEIERQIALYRVAPHVGAAVVGSPTPAPSFFAVHFLTKPIQGYFVEAAVLKHPPKGTPDEVDGKYPPQVAQITPVTKEEVETMYQLRLGRLPTEEEVRVGIETFPKAIRYPTKEVEKSWGVRVRVLLIIPGKVKKYKAVELRIPFTAAQGVSQ